MKNIIIVAILVILISSVSAMDTTNLVSKYSFSGNANDATGSFNATVTGAELRTGYYGQGYIFDGLNDVMTITTPSLYQNKSNVSFNVWVKTNFTDVAGYSTIYDWHSFTAGEQGGIYPKITLNDMAANVVHRDGADDGENGGASDVPYQTWKMLTYVFNDSNAIGRSTVDYYVDGVWADWDDFDGNGTIPSRILRPSSANAYIGARTGASNWYNGTMDELSIWNRKLTPAEITAMYSNYSGGGDPINITPSQTEFYFAQNGSDTTGDGTERKPYQTIKKLNTISLQPSNKVYFACGNLWNTVNDTYPTMQNGASTGSITFNAYGNCQKDVNGYVTNKPRFVATNYTTNALCWDNTATGNVNVWNYTCGIGFEPVARVVGDVNQNISKKATSTELIMNLTQEGIITYGQGYYFPNITNNELRIYSTANPITYYGSLLLVYDVRMFSSYNAQYINIYNLSIEWTGEHGIDFEDDTDYVNIKENDFHDIGGHIQTISGTGRNTRYGNAVQLYRGAAYVNVSKNRCWETYDACYTAQTSAFAGGASLNNITFNYNLAWDSAYCGEFFQGDDESNFKDITYANNSCYRAGLGWYYTQRANTINGRCIRQGGSINTSNFRVYNNLCMAAEEYALGQAFPITDNAGTDVTGTTGTNTTWYFDYNLWYKNSSASYSLSSTLVRWDSTNYATINAFSSALLRETNSKNESTTFADITTNRYNPLFGSIACSMSNTGTYVGALPCAAGYKETMSLTNVMNHSITDTTNIVNWTNPSDIYYNYTYVYLNGTLQGNSSYPLNSFSLSGLQADSGYVVTLTPYDDFGSYGLTSTLTFTTESTTISGSGTYILNVNNSEYMYNLTFLQRPYFLWFNMTVNISNIQLGDQPLSHTVSCDAGIASCSDSNDGTSSEAIVSTEGTFENVTKNFYNSFTESDAVLLNYTVRTDEGGVWSFCKNNLNQFVELEYIYYDGALTTYTKNISIRELQPNCLSRDNITIRFGLYRPSGIKNMGLVEAGLVGNESYYIEFEDSLIYGSRNAVNNSQFFNLTSRANANTDENISVLFGSYGAAVYGFNISYLLLYNKTINLSVKDIRDNSSLNPSCVMNGITYTPATEFIYYNSSEDNYITCTLLGYGSVSEYVTPSDENMTLYMGGFGLNIMLKNEQTDELISGTEMFVYIIQDSYAENFTTTNGTMNLSYLAMPPGEFEIRYGGTGYATRSYFTTLLAETNLELYDVLLNDSSLIVFNVIDERGYPVTNSLLKVQRYFLDSGAYELVGMEQIDNTGNAGMYLIPNTVPYIIIVEKDTEVVFVSSPNKLFLDSIQIHAKLLDNPMESYYKLNSGLTTSLSFDNSTKIVSYFWNDASGIVREACVEVIYRGNTGTGSLGSDCATTSSGTLYVDLTGLLNDNTEYTARGIVKTTTTFSEKITDAMTIFQGGGLAEAIGKTGLFFAYLLIISMFFIGLMFDFGIAVIYTCISLIIVNFMGIGYFPQALVVAISIVGLLISMVSKRT